MLSFKEEKNTNFDQNGFSAHEDAGSVCIVRL